MNDLGVSCRRQQRVAYLQSPSSSGRGSDGRELFALAGSNSLNDPTNDVNNNEIYARDEEEADSDDSDIPMLKIVDCSGVNCKKSTNDDVSDRFKYQVQALMGAFDPEDVEIDKETVPGNIFNALLQFPVEHTFHVVGKTSTTASAQAAPLPLKDQFVAAVQAIVQNETRELPDRITTQVTPRGTKFTKVSISVQVQSAEMITAIYNQFQALESSVMQF